MTEDKSPRIYWANAMFSEADRQFNERCVDVLRKVGYRVFLPQEDVTNLKTGDLSPSSEDIFRIDTAAILDADLVVACIDQETIDCGVACEVGIAVSYGIPVIGLYTDIRQYRKGSGHMYKNLYVIGAIESLGEVTATLEDLVTSINKHLSKRQSDVQKHKNLAVDHFGSIAPDYKDFVTELESWYEPKWTSQEVVDYWFEVASPRRILEYGCGTGDQARRYSQNNSRLTYLGYDGSGEIVQLANSAYGTQNCLFTDAWGEVEKQAKEETFDMAIALFALHDHPDPHDVAITLVECLRPGGILLIVDLCTLDLPALTHLLRRKLARPLSAPDARLDPAKLRSIATKSKAAIIDCSLITPLVHFPSANSLSRYLEIFGIYKGMDLPLGFQSNRASNYRHLCVKVIESQSYPFTDQRAFMACALRKQ